MEAGPVAIPGNVLKLFWDADKPGIDVRRHARYIIYRVLDFGATAEVRWLFDTYGEAVVRQVVASNPQLHPKSLNYWRKRFGLAGDEVLADRVAEGLDV